LLAFGGRPSNAHRHRSAAFIPVWRCAVEKPYHRHRRLLRANGERPGRGTAERGNIFPPSDVE